MAEGVKEIKDVTLVWEATGASGVFTLNTDMPGGTITSRRQFTLATTSARKEETIPCDVAGPGSIVGKQVQFRVDPGVGGVLKLYSGKIRFRTIGVYLDGTLGDTWISQPMTLGS